MFTHGGPLKWNILNNSLVFDDIRKTVKEKIGGSNYMTMKVFSNSFFFSES